MRNTILSMAGIAMIALTLPLGFGGHKSSVASTEIVAAPVQQKLASGNDLYCAGFISVDPIDTKLQVIANEDKTLTSYAEGNRVVYLSHGEKDGVKAGDVYVVIRSEGKFKNEFNKKKLGYSVRELGVIKVVAAQYNTATADVVFACEDFKNGDYLKPVERRPTPEIRSYRPLNKYNDNTLKLNAVLGQIVDTRYHLGTAVERTIVHLDLGKDDGVNVGDYFTVLSRAEGMTEEKFVNTRANGTVKGIPGKDNLGHDVKETRSLPATVAGEVVVIHVEGKSAVAFVTRQTKEILLGDFVERQD